MAEKVCLGMRERKRERERETRLCLCVRERESARAHKRAATQKTIAFEILLAIQYPKDESGVGLVGEGIGAHLKGAACFAGDGESSRAGEQRAPAADGKTQAHQLEEKVSACVFPAIFNFGDSNSDTGGLSAAFGFLLPPPYGSTFFHGPSTGRDSDGRLLIDFIAEELGLPYLDAYLQSVGSNFQRGANFATGGSTIRVQNTTLAQSGYSPFSLGVQVSQFMEFKQRALTYHTRGLL